MPMGGTAATSLSIATPRERYAFAVGGLGLYLFAAFAVVKGSFTEIGLFLMLVSMVMTPRRVVEAYRREPVLWIAALGAAYVVVRALGAAREFPGTADEQMEQINDWLRYLSVFVIAWALAQDPRRLWTASALFAAGVLYRLLAHTPWAELDALLRGALPPQPFGWWHTTFGSYLGAALIVLVFVVPAAVPAAGGRARRVAVWAALGVVLFLVAEGVLATKSRGVWLALLLAVPPGLLLLAGLRRRGLGGAVDREVGRAALLALVVFAAALLPQAERVTERATAEPETYQAFIREGIEETPRTSLGTRLHVYRLGLERWLERPLLGWGTGSAAMVIAESGRFDPEAYLPPHFHNLVLAILVRFGLVGLALAGAVVTIALVRLAGAVRRGDLPAAWVALLFASTLFYMAWSMADVDVLRWDSRNYAMLFFAMVLASVPPWARPGRLERLRALYGARSESVTAARPAA